MSQLDSIEKLVDTLEIEYKSLSDKYCDNKRERELIDELRDCIYAALRVGTRHCRENNIPWASGYATEWRRACELNDRINSILTYKWTRHYNID